ncbi:hypothetical protein GCM10023332_15070 [Luteimonas vadosa]|uniref:Uncharacterized protein n=1 Tax=Luteimonas vadosa TaxID=1165507 RepID=A0ABP9E1N8_9GAMM
MKSLLVLLFLAVIAWTGYSHYKTSRAQVAPAESLAYSITANAPARESVRTPGAKGDGRTHCSQMRSAAVVPLMGSGPKNSYKPNPHPGGT